VNSNETTAAIWVRSGDAPHRQRFTIAHELGHLLLHEAGAEYRDDTFRGTPKEYEANAFAADLLMPLWMLDPAAAKWGRHPGYLAQIFGVSEQAMSIRLGRLVGV
jgi:Zn-dependent peptidase ImmA (M78 family)